MQSVINQNLFRHKSSDTKGFNNLCTIIHQLREEGVYEGEVHINNHLAGSFQLMYTKSHPESQVNIDASVYDALYRRTRKQDLLHRLLVGMDGYVVMFASGHHKNIFITLTRRGNDKTFIYDTRNPRIGDRIVFTTIFPGYYRLSSTDSEMEVIIGKKGNKYYAPFKLKPEILSVSRAGFSLRKIAIAPLQPLLVELAVETSLSFEMIRELKEDTNEVNSADPV